MMKYLAFILITCTATISIAQQSETREVGSFSGVKAAEAIDVYLKKGEKESVRVEVSSGSPTEVITEVSGSYLKVHMRDNNSRRRDMSVKVYVTYVSINKLSASSAGSIYSEGTVKANSMDISGSSAGTIDIAIDAETASVSASSAADVELRGKARSISVDASSAGQINAYDLASEKVDASASSGGSVKVNVNKELDAHASSGGSIRYRGNPDKSITESSSGGSVKKSN
ncbi:MAG TPA: head GIN domain-containing protein [Chryseosolibacter sp.]|nr:head GIN domain-containing protein [Chryseosolibacter sp.]